MRFKKKKVTKIRGSKTHGYGSKKKHRGAGNRGGRGRAGSGKKADQKKPSFWKDKSWRYGIYGFKPPKQKKVRTINVGHLSDIIGTLVEKGIAKLEKDTYHIDLSKIGIDKLLGGGKVTKKIIIKVKEYTDSAKEKIESLGGSIQ